MNVTQAQLQILIEAQNRASSVLKEIQGDTENLEKKAGTLSSAFQGLMGIVASYAGAHGIGMLIDSYTESAKATAQARFFLAGYTKDVDGTLGVLQKFGKEMQKTIGADDEYATLVASKLLPRVKDLNKARNYAGILLRGERIGMMDAQQSANMMIKASEGNEKALRMLLEQMGLSVPKFASLDSMFALLNGKITEGEKAMPAYTTELAKLSQAWGDIKENAGAPLVHALGIALGALNNLIQAFPALADVASGAFLTISAGLLLLGAGKSLDGLLGMLGMTSTQFGLWGLAIGSAIGIATYYIGTLDERSTEWKENALVILGAVGAGFVALMAFLGSAFFLPFILALGAMMIATSMSIEGYEMSWNGFKQYLKDTWTGIKLYAVEYWGYAMDWIKAKMDTVIGALKNVWQGFADFFVGIWDAIKSAIGGAWNYINGIVTQIIDAVNRAIQAMRSMPGVGMIGSAIGAVANFAGFRADGGSVQAGKTYVVGEQGMEFFTPTQNGYITPNNAIGGGNGVIININNPTILDETGARKLVDITLDAFGRSHLFGT